MLSVWVECTRGFLWIWLCWTEALGFAKINKFCAYGNGNRDSLRFHLCDCCRVDWTFCGRTLHGWNLRSILFFQCYCSEFAIVIHGFHVFFLSDDFACVYKAPPKMPKATSLQKSRRPLKISHGMGMPSFRWVHSSSNHQSFWETEVVEVNTMEVVQAPMAWRLQWQMLCPWPTIPS